MEAERKSLSRAVQRCYQCYRFEEQILALAYEQVYSQTRRPLMVLRPAEKCSNNEPAVRRA
jgi:hypothetical protein